jgi:iron(III) transport system substrate-binding protein
MELAARGTSRPKGRSARPQACIADVAWVTMQRLHSGGVQMKIKHQMHWTIAAICLVTACAFGPAAHGQASKSASGAQADLDALVKAAKAEGSLTFYSGATENVAKRVADAFQAKYGIKTQFVRLSGNTIIQRYSNEATAGNIAADVVFNASRPQVFAEEGIAKGWVDAIAGAGLPVLKAGEFPAKFNFGATALIQIAPWSITYNTEKVSAADAPKEWRDLLNPKWKGQILMSDPRSSNAYLDLYAVWLDRYGESFFDQLRAQNLRWYVGGPPQVQGLAAGEGMVGLPVIGPQVQSVKDKGAPLAVITPELTSGVEMHVMITARAKSKSPNAARLMANYVMSVEGNKVFNDDPGGMSIYDTSRLPKEYQPANVKNEARKDQISKLLGLQ